jgi:hypothetical protein
VYASPGSRRCVVVAVGVACVLLQLAAPALAASSGELLWVRTYRPASGSASFSDVAARPRSAAYAVGFRRGGQTHTLVLIKYDRDGRRRWVRALRDDYRATVGRAVGLDASGNVYVGGDVAWWSGEDGILLAKYAPDGTRRWSRTWNPMHGTAGWNADSLRAMVVDFAGNVYVAAESDVGWSDASDGITVHGLVVAKYSARGKRLWAVRYRDPTEPTTLGTFPNDLALDGGGDVYVLGARAFYRDLCDTRSTGSILKFSGADGSLLASAAYGAPSLADARSVDVRDATVAVGDWEGFVIVCDLSLEQRYAARIGSVGLDVALDPTGNTLVTGSAQTLKFGPDGILQWERPDAGRWIRTGDAGDSYVGSDFGALRVSRYDDAGVLLWSRTWAAEAGQTRAFCFTLARDAVYIGGQLSAHGRAVLVKYAR